METTLKAWRNQQIYMTNGVTAAQEKILSQNCVCVVGLPGAGKSTAIHHAALSLEREGFFINAINGPEEFLKCRDENKKQVFILDNVLGIHSLMEDEINLWNKHNADIRKLLGTNTKLLVSIRTQIYNQAIKDNSFVFLDKATCIDFSDQTYRLEIADMKAMLTHCLTVQGVDKIDDLIRQIWGFTEKQVKDMTDEDRQEVMSRYEVGQEFSHCFPLLCKVFCSDESVRHNPHEFFRNPFQALSRIFAKIKSDNELQFCGLVLCTVFDGKLTDDMFSINLKNADGFVNESEVLLNVIIKSCNLEGKETECLPHIKHALNSLDGVYVTHIEDKFKMAHSVFHDVVTFLFNATQPLFVLKYGTSQFIRDRIRLSEKQPKDDPYMIIINDDTNIERLVDRLFRDLKSDPETGARLIASNPNIADEKLIESLGRKLSDGEQTDRTLNDELFRQCILTIDSSSYKDGDVSQYNLIKFCVRSGADCNLFIGGNHPLHRSVMAGSLQLTEFLLENGADKRVVDCYSCPVLHYSCLLTQHNKLELVKLLLEHGEDQSVVKFVTSDRQGILQALELDSDIDDSDATDRQRIALPWAVRDDDHIQLEEVLSDKSIKVLTKDREKVKQYVEHHAGKLQLVKPVHDNVLTYVDKMGRNILHYLAHDSKTTSYVLSLLPNKKQAVNQRDRLGRNPYWYVVNKQHPGFGTVTLDDKDRQDLIQLYEGNDAILYIGKDDSSDDENVEVIYDQNIHRNDENTCVIGGMIVEVEYS